MISGLWPLEFLHLVIGHFLALSELLVVSRLAHWVVDILSKSKS